MRYFVHAGPNASADSMELSCIPVVTVIDTDGYQAGQDSCLLRGRHHMKIIGNNRGNQRALKRGCWRPRSVSSISYVPASVPLTRPFSDHLRTELTPVDVHHKWQEWFVCNAVLAQPFTERPQPRSVRDHVHRAAKDYTIEMSSGQ